MRSRLLLAVACSWIFTFAAQASERIWARAYVEDPSGRWTLEQAQAQQLQSFKGLLTQGFGEGAIWVRLRVEPTLSGAAPSEPLFLRIRPIFLDDLRVYDEADGFAPRKPMGDRHPLAAQDEVAMFYLAKLAPSNTPRDVWVRLKTTSTRLAHFEVLDEASLRQSAQRIQTFGGVFLALIGVFGALGLWQALSKKDALSWSFTLYQAQAFLNGATTLGYFRIWTAPWLPAALLDRAFSLLAVIFPFGILLYSFFLARELGPSRVRTLFFYGLTSTLIGLVAMQLFGLVSLSLKINIFLAGFMPLWLLIDALLYKPATTEAPKDATLSKRSVVVYFSLTLVFAYIVVLPATGLVQAVEFTIYSILFYSLTSGLLMLGMLQYRANYLQRQREVLLYEASAANQLAQLERMQRLERERLIAMLGHELKTPLSTLRMMLGDKALPQHAAQQMSEPIQEINELIERTVQTGQLENNAIGLRPVCCQLSKAIEQPLSQLPEFTRIAWTANPPADQLEVETDPFLLGVVVRNLVDNALKYSPDGSQVQVDLHADGKLGLWVLEVHNQVGRAGFPDSEHVFDKFWRSPKASYRSGSGQGLFIAWRLAQLMGGTLRYLPEGDSVCFRLELPFTPPVSPTPSASAAAS